MKTILIITPHMSTGGCPQVVVKKIEMFKDVYNVVCVEWSQISWHFLVQRNRAIELLGDKFISLSENKEYDLFNVIQDDQPDYIMMEEIAETFIPNHILKRLYSSDRKYKIFETTHSSYSKPEQKQFLPDKFIFVSPFSVDTFKDIGVPIDYIEYPVDEKESRQVDAINRLNLESEYKHVLNVGLFTPGKNQKYAFEIAEKLKDYKIKFHFLGNQAGNFEDYWIPLMENKPENCIVWGERSDVDEFLQASDLFLYTSILELNPISIKESLEYNLPTMIFDLKTYYGKYNNDKNISLLTGDVDKDAEKIVELLHLKPKVDRDKLNLKVVHLVLNPDEKEDIPDESWKSTIWKQDKSIECWENMSDKFSTYIKRYTKVNRTELPTENCAHPEIINPSKEFKNEPPVLSYGHYGAYLAHKNGILENFDEDVDALIIVEGDVVTDLNPEDFKEKILDAYYTAIEKNIGIVSFAGPKYLSGGHWWETNKDYGDWLKVDHFLLGSTYIVMKSERDKIIKRLKTKPWHSPDFWLAWYNSGKTNMMVSKDKLVYQLEGYSLLDYKEKDNW